MADGASFRDASAQALKPPALAWRRPVWLWLLLTLAIGGGWPLLFLDRQTGVAQLASIAVGVALLIACAALAIAFRIGRPPSLRIHVVIYMMVATVATALLVPFAFVGLLGFLAGIERGEVARGMEIAGLSQDRAWALAPLALMVGAPVALVAGVALSVLGFRKRKAIPSDAMVADRAQLSESAPSDDDASM